MKIFYAIGILIFLIATTKAATAAAAARDYHHDGHGRAKGQRFIKPFAISMPNADRRTTLSSTWNVRSNIPGEPEVDYPIYSAAPETSFSCVGRHDGYYADVEARCQVFRVCANTDRTGRGFAFLCPNGTLFNQKVFVCDWYTRVQCSDSVQFYAKNLEHRKPVGNRQQMMATVMKMVGFTFNGVNSVGQSLPKLTTTVPAQRFPPPAPPSLPQAPLFVATNNRPSQESAFRMFNSVAQTFEKPLPVSTQAPLVRPVSPLQTPLPAMVFGVAPVDNRLAAAPLPLYPQTTVFFNRLPVSTEKPAPFRRPPIGNTGFANSFGTGFGPSFGGGGSGGGGVNTIPASEVYVSSLGELSTDREADFDRTKATFLRIGGKTELPPVSQTFYQPAVRPAVQQQQQLQQRPQQQLQRPQQQQQQRPQQQLQRQKVKPSPVLSGDGLLLTGRAYANVLQTGGYILPPPSQNGIGTSANRLGNQNLRLNLVANQFQFSAVQQPAQVAGPTAAGVATAADTRPANFPNANNAFGSVATEGYLNFNSGTIQGLAPATYTTQFQTYSTAFPVQQTTTTTATTARPSQPAAPSAAFSYDTEPLLNRPFVAAPASFDNVDNVDISNDIRLNEQTANDKTVASSLPVTSYPATPFYYQPPALNRVPTVPVTPATSAVPTFATFPTVTTVTTPKPAVTIEYIDNLQSIVATTPDTELFSDALSDFPSSTKPTKIPLSLDFFKPKIEIMGSTGVSEMAAIDNHYPKKLDFGVYTTEDVYAGTTMKPIIGAKQIYTYPTLLNMSAELDVTANGNGVTNIASTTIKLTAAELAEDIEEQKAEAVQEELFNGSGILVQDLDFQTLTDKSNSSIPNFDPRLVINDNYDDNSPQIDIRGNLVYENGRARSMKLNEKRDASGVRVESTTITTIIDELTNGNNTEGDDSKTNKAKETKETNATDEVGGHTEKGLGDMIEEEQVTESGVYNAVDSLAVTLSALDDTIEAAATTYPNDDKLDLIENTESPKAVIIVNANRINEAAIDSAPVKFESADGERESRAYFETVMESSATELIEMAKGQTSASLSSTTDLVELKDVQTPSPESLAVESVEVEDAQNNSSEASSDESAEVAAVNAHSSESSSSESAEEDNVQLPSPDPSSAEPIEVVNVPTSAPSPSSVESVEIDDVQIHSPRSSAAQLAEAEEAKLPSPNLLSAELIEVVIVSTSTPAPSSVESVEIDDVQTRSPQSSAAQLAEAEEAKLPSPNLLSAEQIEEVNVPTSTPAPSLIESVKLDDAQIHSPQSSAAQSAEIDNVHTPAPDTVSTVDFAQRIDVATESVPLTTTEETQTIRISAQIKQDLADTVLINALAATDFPTAADISRNEKALNQIPVPSTSLLPPLDGPNIWNPNQYQVNPIKSNFPSISLTQSKTVASFPLADPFKINKLVPATVAARQPTIQPKLNNLTLPPWKSVRVSSRTTYTPVPQFATSQFATSQFATTRFAPAPFMPTTEQPVLLITSRPSYFLEATTTTPPPPEASVEPPSPVTLIPIPDLPHANHSPDIGSIQPIDHFETPAAPPVIKTTLQPPLFTAGLFTPKATATQSIPSIPSIQTISTIPTIPTIPQTTYAAVPLDSSTLSSSFTPATTTSFWRLFPPSTTLLPPTVSSTVAPLSQLPIFSQYFTQKTTTTPATAFQSIPEINQSIGSERTGGVAIAGVATVTDDDTNLLATLSAVNTPQRVTIPWPATTDSESSTIAPVSVSDFGEIVSGRKAIPIPGSELLPPSNETAVNVNKDIAITTLKGDGYRSVSDFLRGTFGNFYRVNRQRANYN